MTSTERSIHRWAPLALAGLAVLLALVATSKGPGLTDDSVNYLSTGINVAEGRGWRMLADQPITIFPPGVPAVVALGEAVGIEGQLTLRLVSALSFGGIVVLGHLLLRRVTDQPTVCLGATALLAVSPALLGISTMAWSEPLFIVLVLLFLLALDTVLERRALRSHDIATLAALASLAFLVRYIGIALVVLAGLALLARLRPLDRATLVRIVVLGLACVPVPVAVMLRNHAADGTYLGQRIPSPDSVLDSGHRILVTLGEWAYPHAAPGSSVLAWLGAAVLAAMAVGAVAAVHAPGERTTVAVLLGFVLVYTAYLLAASLGTAFEPINSRYLSPVHVPLMALGSAAVAAALRRWPAGQAGRAAGVGLVVLGLLWGSASLDDVWTGASDGIGYNMEPVVDSELAAQAVRLTERDPDAVVYSNLPFALWAATRLQPVRWSPLAEGFRGAPIEGELDALVGRVACAPESSYFVRYRFGHRRAMNLEGVRTALDVKRVVVADDGAIFELRTRGDVTCQAPPPDATRPR